MKDPHLIEQDYGNTTSFAFTQFGTEFFKEALNVPPLNVGADGMSKDRLKSSLMLALHHTMVLQNGTDRDSAPVAVG